MPTYANELVSIITPVYNKERYIAQTIDSIRAQTVGDWELLLIDDCSTDRSAAIIEQYRKQDVRIRYHKLAQNGGAAVARNEALTRAKGRYVAFLDADDLWRPGKLEKQLAFMRDKGVGFTYTAIEMIDENGAPRRGKRPVREKVDYHYLLSNTIIACSSVLIDREIVGDFRMPLVRKGQDFATWLSILRKGHMAYGLDEALVLYRVAPGSISSNKWAALARTWHIYRKQEQLPLVSSLWHFGLYTFHAIKKYWM
ncbi:MAG: glycosyltransferase family 2 protein [Ethanoligenens sp.]